MSPIPPPSQTIAVAFLVALFFGLYLSTFFHCMRWLLFTDEGWELRARKSIRWPMTLIALAIFTMSVLNRGIQLKRWSDQVMWYHDPSHSQTRSTDWTDVVLCTSANLTAQLVDAVLIFRLWSIYNQSFRIIAFPVLLWFACLLLTALQIYLQIGQVSKIVIWLPVNMSLGPGIILTPFWASTIVLNIYASFMIIRRLWRFHKESAFGNSKRLVRFSASLIIESGVLYLTSGIAHFVVWWTPDNFAINVVSNINIPIIGIAFNLILIRLAQHRAEEHSVEDGPTESMRFQAASTEKTGGLVVEIDDGVPSLARNTSMRAPEPRQDMMFDTSIVGVPRGDIYAQMYFSLFLVVPILWLHLVPTPAANLESDALDKES